MEYTEYVSVLYNREISNRNSHFKIINLASFFQFLQDKNAFADILKRISKIQKINGSSYVVLKDR